MLPCDKRQTIVNREAGTTRHRCTHHDCEAYRQDVAEEVCAVCPLRAFMRPSPPCKEMLKAPRRIEPDDDCEECKPGVDEELEKALALAGGFDEVVTPEDTPDGEVPDFPPTSVQLWLYKEALKKWHKAGRPVRTAEEVTDILETKCKGCDWYDAAKKRCKGCGCRVTDGGIPVLNKIKMATEHCPHPEKKW